MPKFGFAGYRPTSALTTTTLEAADAEARAESKRDQHKVFVVRKQREFLYVYINGRKFVPEQR